MSRFEYVKYNDKSLAEQQTAKSACEEVERVIDCLPKGRAQALAYTKLEECYMWIGKAIRDYQVSLGKPASLQEERKDG